MTPEWAEIMYWPYAELTAKTPTARPATLLRMVYSLTVIVLSFNTFVNLIGFQKVPFPIVLWSYFSRGFSDFFQTDPESACTHLPNWWVPQIRDSRPEKRR